MAKVHEDDFGILLCQNCSAEITCDENGDMPDTCPECGEVLDWPRISAATMDQE